MQKIYKKLILLTLGIILAYSQTPIASAALATKSSVANKTETLSIQTTTEEGKTTKTSAVCTVIFGKVNANPQQVLQEEEKIKLHLCITQGVTMTAEEKEKYKRAIADIENNIVINGENICVLNPVEFTNQKLTVNTNSETESALPYTPNSGRFIKGDCTDNKKAICEYFKSLAPDICQRNPLSKITFGGTNFKCLENTKFISCKNDGVPSLLGTDSTFESERFDTSNLRANPNQSASFFQTPEDGSSTLTTIINRAINFLVSIASIVALVIFSIGALTLVTSAGNSERVEKGIAMIKYSLTGLAVVLLSYFAVITVQSIFF